MNPKSFKIRSFIFGVMMFMAGGYFAIHGLGLGGNKGYLSIGSLDQDIIKAEEELIALQDHRKWLEHRVSLVNESKVDADMLGELARREGGLYASDEVIINLN